MSCPRLAPRALSARPCYRPTHTSRFTCSTIQTLPLLHRSVSSRTKATPRSHLLCIRHNRCISSTPRRQSEPQSPASLTTGQYHALSDAYIETLLSALEEIAEDDAEWDVEYSAGVLNCAVPGKGTYVINKQPPNRQIWLSSPVSGPKRFDYVLEEVVNEADQGASSPGGVPAVANKGVQGGRWIYLRDGTGLRELLADELGVEIGELPES